MFLGSESGEFAVYEHFTRRCSFMRANQREAFAWRKAAMRCTRRAGHGRRGADLVWRINTFRLERL